MHRKQKTKIALAEEKNRASSFVSARAQRTRAMCCDQMRARWADAHCAQLRAFRELLSTLRIEIRLSRVACFPLNNDLLCAEAPEWRMHIAVPSD